MFTIEFVRISAPNARGVVASVDLRHGDLIVRGATLMPASSGSGLSLMLPRPKRESEVFRFASRDAWAAATAAAIRAVRALEASNAWA